MDRMLIWFTDVGVVYLVGHAFDELGEVPAGALKQTGRLLAHDLITLFVRLFVCSFVRLFVCSFVCLFVCSFVRSFVCLFVAVSIC